MNAQAKKLIWLEFLHNFFWNEFESEFYCLSWVNRKIEELWLLFNLQTFHWISAFIVFVEIGRFVWLSVCENILSLFIFFLFFFLIICMHWMKDGIIWFSFLNLNLKTLYSRLSCLTIFICSHVEHQISWNCWVVHQSHF